MKNQVELLERIYSLVDVSAQAIKSVNAVENDSAQEVLAIALCELYEHIDNLKNNTNEQAEGGAK